MIPIRPPRALPPRYTLDGVSVNELPRRHRRTREATTSRTPQSQRTPHVEDMGNPLGSSGSPRDNGDRENEAQMDQDISAADADVSEPENYDITSLLDRMRRFRVDIDDAPATDAIQKISHSQKDLAIMAKIRVYLPSLLGYTRTKGRGNTISYGPLPSPPSNPEAEEPSSHRPIPAWNKRPSHKYNRLVSLVIARRMINDQDCKDLFNHEDPGLLFAVAKQIRVHIRHLSTVWNEQQYARSLITDEDRNQEDLRRSIVQRAHAADHRRRLTLDRRAATASYYSRPSWIAILNHVGASSMSSDDFASDEDAEVSTTTQPIYYIIGKTWRSSALIEFLRLLDRLADVVEKRTKFIGRTSRTRKPTPINMPTRESARSVFPKLNQEFYSPTQQTAFGIYHRYRKVQVDLQSALKDIQQVASNEGVMV